MGAVVGPRGAVPDALSRRDRLEPNAETGPLGSAKHRGRDRQPNGSGPAPRTCASSLRRCGTPRTRGSTGTRARLSAAATRPAWAAGTGTRVEIPADRVRAVRGLRRRDWSSASREHGGPARVLLRLHVAPPSRAAVCPNSSEMRMAEADDAAVLDGDSRGRCCDPKSLSGRSVVPSRATAARRRRGAATAAKSLADARRELAT